MMTLRGTALALTAFVVIGCKSPTNKAPGATEIPSPATASSVASSSPKTSLPLVPQTGLPIRPITFTALDGPKRSADEFCPGRLKPLPIGLRTIYQDCRIGTAFFDGYSPLKPALKTVYDLVSTKTVSRTEGSVGLLLETASGFYGGESVIFPNDSIHSNGHYISTKVSTEGGALVLTTRASDIYQVDGMDPPPPVYTVREIVVVCTLAGTPKCSEPIRVAETSRYPKPLKGEPVWEWRMSTRVTPQGIEFLAADGGAPRAPTESPEWEITGRVLVPGLYPIP